MLSGVFNETRSSSILIGLSKECKSVVHGAFGLQRCHAVVLFEVERSRFRVVFRDIARTAKADAKQYILHGAFQCVDKD